MKTIGLLSDTHGFLHPRLFHVFGNCGEVWHAGDIGNMQTSEMLSAFKPFRAVTGNIDGGRLRTLYPDHLVFTLEEVKVLMTHIGGYPGRYDKQAERWIKEYRPQLFICGHSHILKVMYDKQHELLHINPGAAGKEGWHRVITLVKFAIGGKEIRDLEVIELDK